MEYLGPLAYGSPGYVRSLSSMGADAAYMRVVEEGVSVLASSVAA